MKIATAHLKSASPYGQGRQYTEYEVPRGEKESYADYEDRTWRNRCHVDKDGQVFIPGVVFKKCLSQVAAYLSMPIKGKGKRTYTKHFLSGILVTDTLPLGIPIEKVNRVSICVPSDGKRGGSKRVLKHFPVFESWEGTMTFYILDETITKDVFLYHLQQSGKFIGIGTYRACNDGTWGRFEVLDVKWQDA
jgi:hypothetical protein